MNIKGDTLANVLNNLIDNAEDENTSRADIIARMARSARISASTVNQILSGDINCPPLSRLNGFASVLGTTMSSLRTAAENDGCEYSANSDNAKSCRLSDLDRSMKDLTDALKSF